MIAIITGGAGQDGTYLAEHLIKDGYTVVSVDISYDHPTARYVPPGVVKIKGDICDPYFIRGVIKDYDPCEVYNLAAHTYVGNSWDTPYSVFDVNSIGCLNVLNAVRDEAPKARIYQASTSEMWGVQPPPHGLKTRMEPVSPYGVAKVAAHHLCRVYRESYGMHVVCGVSLNHESPRRPEIFVTRKITKNIARIAVNRKHRHKTWPLQLGNLDSARDWSHAKDITKAMTMMMAFEEPRDWVVGSGESHTVREFCNMAFNMAGIPVDWSGDGVEEVAIHDGDVVVEVSPDLYRPTDINELRGDSSEIRRELGWEPQYSFCCLVEEMMQYDMGSVGLGL